MSIQMNMMAKRTIYNVLVVLISIFFVCNIYGQSEKKKEYPSNVLADSIHKELILASDTSNLNSLLSLIRRNRVKLEMYYIPLLYEYANRAKLVDYEAGQMQALDRIGLQYRFNEQYDSALYYHNLSLNLAIKLRDSVQLYYNYNNIGQVYRQQNLNVQAIQYFHKALAINEALGDT